MAITLFILTLSISLSRKLLSYSMVDSKERAEVAVSRGAGAALLKAINNLMGELLLLERGRVTTPVLRIDAHFSNERWAEIFG